MYTYMTCTFLRKKNTCYKNDKDTIQHTVAFFYTRHGRTTFIFKNTCMSKKQKNVSNHFFLLKQVCDFFKKKRNKEDYYNDDYQ